MWRAAIWGILPGARCTADFAINNKSQQISRIDFSQASLRQVHENERQANEQQQIEQEHKQLLGARTANKLANYGQALQLGK